jgi:multiple sugar transport system substrate-binding protein
MVGETTAHSSGYQAQTERATAPGGPAITRSAHGRDALRSCHGRATGVAIDGLEEENEMLRPRRAAAVLLAAASVGTLALVGCSSSGSHTSSSSSSKSLTVWSEENDPQRMAEQRKIFAQFTAATGIKVNLVGVAENQFSTLVTSSAAAGNLPDVVGALPVSDADQLALEKIADPAAASAVVNELGRSTFQSQVLQLATQNGQLVGVPSDSWVQLLVYRKDLFAKYNLPAPTSYAAILSDAAALKSHGYIGMVAATDANDAFTEQTFEYVSLANGCQLVSAKGTVTLGSASCQQAFSFYNNLIKNDSVSGSQTVDTTSQEYLAGKAGMVIWSSYILPVLAGQEQGSVPSCPQCKSDPAYLAKNSGIETSISGAGSSAPTDYGQISTWVISQQSKNVSGAEKFVEYMMNQGYSSWLSLDPPGKLPVRTSTSAGPVSAKWSALPIALGAGKPTSSYYAASTISNLLAGPAHVTEWGLPVSQVKNIQANM